MSAASFLHKERSVGEGSKGDGDEQDHVKFVNHVNHNILDPCIRLLDHEVLERVIQTARWSKSQYNEEEIMAAIDQLFSKWAALITTWFGSWPEQFNHFPGFFLIWTLIGIFSFGFTLPEQLCCMLLPPAPSSSPWSDLAFPYFAQPIEWVILSFLCS